MRWSRLLALLVPVLASGCLLLPEREVEPEPEPRPAVATDLLEPGGLELPVGPGWSAVHLKTNATFWEKAKPYHSGTRLVFRIDVDEGYHLVGTLARTEEARAPVFIGGTSGGFSFTWDADSVGVEPELEFLILGGSPKPSTLRAYVGDDPRFGASVEVLPALSGTDGAGGMALRVNLDTTLVLSMAEGVAQVDEEYVEPIVATPVGGATARRVTSVLATDNLAAPGIAVFYTRSVEAAGAGAWSYSLTTGNHTSSFQAPLAWPGGSAADAAPAYLWVETEAGDIQLDIERTFSGFYTHAAGAVPAQSVFTFSCAWADVDVSQIGWEFEPTTPQDQVTQRALSLVPEPPA